MTAADADSAAMPCGDSISTSPLPRVRITAGNLAGEEDFGACAQLQRGGEEGGGVDVGIAVDLAEAEELGIFEAGNEAQDAGLFAELHMVLKTDQVEDFVAQVLD